MKDGHVAFPCEDITCRRNNRASGAVTFGVPRHPTIIPPLREQCGKHLAQMCGKRRDSTFDYRTIAARAQRSTKIRHASSLHYPKLSI
jgi:hypothetical protein